MVWDGRGDSLSGFRYIYQSVREELEGLNAPRKMLILPAKAEQRERIFIEA